MWTGQYLDRDRIEPVQTPIPEPAAADVLIQVDACGICGSDLSIVSGNHPRAQPPLTIGHEFFGRVVDLGPQATGVSAGDRVVVYPLLSCGQCYVCRHGQPHVCRTLRLYGIDCAGGMAEYALVRSDLILKIPETLPLEAAGLIEPLAVAVHAAARAPVDPSGVVAVLGAGPIGLLMAFVLRHQGVARLCLTDPIPFRRELAARLGFEALDPQSQDVAALLRARTDGEGVDMVFECAGAPSAAAAITDLVRCRGTIVNVGVHKKPPAVDLRSLNFKELTLIGSRVYTLDDFRSAISIASRLPLASLVSHQFGLTEITSAFATFKGGDDVCKVLIRPTY